MYLDLVKVDNIITIDSVKMGKKGTFSFKTNVDVPTFFSLRTKRENIPFVAQPEDDIKIKGNYENLSANYTIDGSETSSLINLLNIRMRHTRHILDSLKEAYVAVPQGVGFDEMRKNISSEWDSTMVRQIRFSRDFIMKHAISLASYYALYQKLDNNNFLLYPKRDGYYYRIVASSMRAMYPESQYTKAILAHYDQIAKYERNQAMLEYIQSSEKYLPEIRLPDIQGDTIAFSSLRGKFIILDFTSLTTAGSEEHIKKLQEIYNKYKSQGLEIYQVCLDRNKLAWEEMVKRYNIKWVCVYEQDIDQSRAVVSWNVQALPYNYLIDKDYDIVGKYLFGKNLDDRLRDLLK
ncbi:MAG: AhpC/TSA family protein [Odoribacter sp.]|nr:AhpC/TSA family protein [Odoribacter sp.]